MARPTGGRTICRLTAKAGLALAGTLAILALATAPSHAAVTIGSNLAGDPEATINCPGDDPCTLGQALPESSRAVGGATAPNSGVVVRWRIKVGIGATDIFVSPTALRVLRPAGGGMWTGAGTSTVQTPAADITSTFATRLPIAAGDELGIDCCADSSQYFANTVGATIPTWLPRLADGETRPTDDDPYNAELLVNADVEPDADGDGFGDETQDGCPTDASTQGPCPPDDGAPPPDDGTPPPDNGTTPPPDGVLLPSNEFSFGKVKKNKKKGTAKLTVKNLPGPGELELAKNKKVKGKEKTADASKEKLPIKPKRKAKKRLNKRGKTKVRAKVTYTPDGGEPNTRKKKLKLKKR